MAERQHRKTVEEKTVKKANNEFDLAQEIEESAEEVLQDDFKDLDAVFPYYAYDDDSGELHLTLFSYKSGRELGEWSEIASTPKEASKWAKTIKDEVIKTAKNYIEKKKSAKASMEDDDTPVEITKTIDLHELGNVDFLYEEALDLIKNDGDHLGSVEITKKGDKIIYDFNTTETDDLAELVDWIMGDIEQAYQNNDGAVPDLSNTEKLLTKELNKQTESLDK